MLKFTRDDAGIQAGLNKLYADEANWKGAFQKPFSNEAQEFVFAAMKIAPHKADFIKTKSVFRLVRAVDKFQLVFRFERDKLELVHRPYNVFHLIGTCSDFGLALARLFRK